MPLSPVATTDAFRFVTVGSTVVAADQVGDNLTLNAGLNITFTADANSDTITINAGAAAGAVSANLDATNASRFIPFLAGTTGSQNVLTDANLFFNPSTNTLTTDFFSGDGSGLTGLTAGNLTGTIPSTVLGNSTVFIGTTAIGLNRSSGSQTLTGVSIDGNAGTATTATSATSATRATNLAGGNSTTLFGSIPYQSNTNITTLLSPNTTTNKRFLTMTGDGTNGAAPSWAAILAADVPTLNQNTTGTAAGLSGTQTQNTVYAAPSASNGTASFRALVASDIPTVNIATNLAGGNNTTLLGTIPYQSNTNTTTLLSPNVTTTLAVLTQTGTGSNGAVPVWTSSTGTGNVVLATSPTITTPTIAAVTNGNASSTTDADAIVDASTTGIYAYVQSASGTARTIQISNLTAGRRVYLYLRNTNAATKAITIQASTTTTGFANVALSGSFVGANAVGQVSASVVTLAATTGTATVMVFNANATIGGAVI